MKAKRDVDREWEASGPLLETMRRLLGEEWEDYVLAWWGETVRAAFWPR